jgi:hypothetical protein
MVCFISSHPLRYSSFVLGFLARGFELRVNLGEGSTESKKCWFSSSCWGKKGNVLLIGGKELNYEDRKFARS